MSNEPLEENLASKAIGAIADAFACHDWSALRRSIADDCHLEDRRTLLGAGGFPGSPNGYVDTWKSWAELGFDKNENDPPIATRGRSMAVIRGVVTGSHGWEVGAIVLAIANADGRLVFLMYFDYEDVEAALAELDEQQRLRSTSL